MKLVPNDPSGRKNIELKKEQDKRRQEFIDFFQGLVNKLISERKSDRQKPPDAPSEIQQILENIDKANISPGSTIEQISQILLGSQAGAEEPLDTLSMDTILNLMDGSNAEEGGAEEGGAEEGGAGGCAANWPDLDASPFKRAFSQEEVAKAFTEAFEKRREREKMLDRQGVNGTTCRAVLDGHHVVIKRHQSRDKAAHEAAHAHSRVDEPQESRPTVLQCGR